MPRLDNGRLHFLFTSLFGLGGIAVCVWLLRDLRWWEWLTIPITLLYANLAEYIGHGGPMHRRNRYAPIIFDGHTGIHHRFFTEEAFAYDSPRDWHALLLPPYLIVFFLGLFAAPVAALLYFAVSPNVAYLTVASALGYFVSYEWMHFCYHAPEDSLLLRSPFMRQLRQHHMTHHNPRLMTRYNFNITFPIFDWVFRTTYRREGTSPKGHWRGRQQTSWQKVQLRTVTGRPGPGDNSARLAIGPHPQAGDEPLPPEHDRRNGQQPAPQETPKTPRAADKPQRQQQGRHQRRENEQHQQRGASERLEHHDAVRRGGE